MPPRSVLTTHEHTTIAAPWRNVRCHLLPPSELSRLQENAPLEGETATTHPRKTTIAHPREARAIPVLGLYRPAQKLHGEIKLEEHLTGRRSAHALSHHLAERHPPHRWGTTQTRSFFDSLQTSPGASWRIWQVRTYAGLGMRGNRRMARARRVCPRTSPSLRRPR